MQATLLSTYPPRACGLATFAQNLRSGLASAGVASDVVASVRESGLPGRLDEVRFELVQDDQAAYAAAARSLDADVVSIQHEFGIFGGSEGLHVLDFMEASAAPVVTTLHTVLPTPPEHYHRALVKVARQSDRLVVMTETARRLLRDVYDVPEAKVAVIPHGTPVLDAPAPDLRQRLGLEGRTVLLTFGLLGPSKGIEFALESLAPVVEARPDVLYVVLGATHPEIVKHEGEAYRERLIAEVEALGLSEHVRFENRYVTGSELGEWLQAADVYVSPYPGMDQICSGTLAYALAAGLPVVSTPYLHAAEVLADGAGALVPFGDTDALGAALARFASDEDARAAASARAREIGASTAWPETGAAYRAVFEEVAAEAAARRQFRVHPGALPAALDSLAALTDDVGPIQHAAFGIPDRRHGYSADDAARALVAVYAAARRLDRPSADLFRVARTSLSFLHHAQRPDGSFHNFMDYGRQFLDSSGGEDTAGRALWGLGATAAWAPDEASRQLALRLVQNALGLNLTHPRALAYALTGFELALHAEPHNEALRGALRSAALGLVDHFDRTQAPDWPWVSDGLTYSNAIVPHALLSAAGWLDADEAARVREVGRLTADFLLEQTVHRGQFDAIGNRGWLVRGGERATFDQQPIDAGYSAWFWADAAERTGDVRFADAARLAIEWFYGRNRIGASLFDEATGACFDGITREGVNLNQGAESVIAGVLAHLAAVDLGLVEAEPGRDRVPVAAV